MLHSPVLWPKQSTQVLQFFERPAGRMSTSSAQALSWADTLVSSGNKSFSSSFHLNLRGAYMPVWTCATTTECALVADGCSSQARATHSVTQQSGWRWPWNYTSHSCLMIKISSRDSDSLLWIQQCWQSRMCKIVHESVIKEKNGYKSSVSPDGSENVGGNGD